MNLESIYFCDQPNRWPSCAAVCNRQGGFTLLEILLAIAIFAIVATTLLGTYNRVFSLTAMADSRSKNDQAGRIAMMRIMMDLQNLIITPMPLYNPKQKDPDVADPHAFVAEQVSLGQHVFGQLRFASLAHVYYGRGAQNGIARIVYYIESMEGGGYSLHRADRLFADQPFAPDPTDPVLCRYVTEFSLKFFYADDIYDAWDSDSPRTDHATPQAIGIQLSIGSADHPLQTVLSLETRIDLPMFRSAVKS